MVMRTSLKFRAPWLILRRKRTAILPEIVMILALSEEYQCGNLFVQRS